MPTYDYFCETNGRVIEVSHRISEELATWGELCARAGVGIDGTDRSAPVKRLITSGNVVRSESLGSGKAPPCESGAPCCGGVCGLN